MGNLESLRRLAGGPKLAAAQSVAGFLYWAAHYVPPSRWAALEIDGVAPAQLYAAPEAPRGTGLVSVRCRRCVCTTTEPSGLCVHCIFGEPCPKAPTGETREPSQWSFLEIDNPVDRDAVADGIVMAFFAIRGGHGAVD